MRRRHGFSLVELLVVVAIIAILMSITLPSLGRARELAKTTICLTHLRGLGQAEFLFAQEHNNYIQPVSNDWPQGSWVSTADPTHTRWVYWLGTQGDGTPGDGCAKDWASALIPYTGASDKESTSFVTGVKQSNIFVCPSDPYQFGNSTTSGYQIYSNVPTLNNPNYFPISYGINADIAALVGVGTGNSGTDGFGRIDGYPNNAAAASSMNVAGGPKVGLSQGQPLGARILQVARQSETMLFGDCGTRLINNNPIQSPMDYYDSLFYTTNWATGAYSTLKDLGTVAGSYLGPRIPYNRHPGQNINFVFCDYHAESVNPNNFSKVMISPW